MGAGGWRWLVNEVRVAMLCDGLQKGGLGEGGAGGVGYGMVG